MGTLDLLRVGRKNRKNYTDKSHDVNTTSDFGFCQPTLCDLIIPGSNVSLKTKEFCRLGVLPTPTFGRVKIHTDTSFQKVKDVFPAFDNLMSQTLVNNPNVSGGYIPQGHNYMSKGDLISTLVAMSFYYARLGEWDKVPFRFDVYFNGGMLQTELTSNFTQPSHLFPWRSILNDPELASGDRAPLYMRGGYETLVSLFGANGVMYGANGFAKYNRNGEDFVRDVNITDGGLNFNSTVNTPPVALFLTYLAERTESIYNKNGGTFTFDQLPTTPDAGLGLIYDKSLLTQEVTYDAIMEVYKNFPAVSTEAITVDNCDYYYIIGNDILSATNVYDDDSASHSVTMRDDNKLIVCIKATAFGRRILKVLTGLYNTDNFSKNIPDYPTNRDFSVSQHEVISLTPLFAYYKHWFDLYNPAREHTWFDTNAFKLIHCFYDFPQPLHAWLTEWGDGTTDPISIYNYLRLADSLKSVRKAWFDFFVDLAQCVYVLPVDNITVATPTPVGNVQSDVNDMQFPYAVANEPSELNPNPSMQTASAGLSDNFPYGSDDNGATRAGGLGVNMLLRLYNWSNKNSVIRQNLRAYLKKYGIELPKDNILDRNSYYAQIDDIFSTAETNDGFLGQYAGKGIGSGMCSVSLQETKEYGFLIQSLCISPHSGYVQANALYPITRMEHYQPEFDSLGMEAMSMRQVQGRDYNLSATSGSRLFGFRPRYFDLKVKNNVANGYFANRGAMSQYLPYSLDRIFAVPDINSSVSELTFNKGYYPLANEDIRKVGLVEQLGEYDRIFVDNTGMIDNFIFNILQEYKVWSPVKPVSDSFDTFDKETDDDTYKVEHS